MSRFLTFSRVDADNIIVKNRKDEVLGIIYLDDSWGKWVWEHENFKFDAECLEDIADYLRSMKR